MLHNAFLFFEGFFDFLSHIQLYGWNDGATYIVLNSTALAERAANYVVAQATVPAGVQLWFDNDDAGRAAAAVIKHHFPAAIDMSGVYAGHGDLNDYCVSLFKYKYSKDKRMV